MPGPLDGIRVIEVAIWWFVPAAGGILADWGAEVIKVEHPETGDPQRALFTSGLVPDTGGVNFMMEQSNPDGFNVDSLTRTDSLYFTVTVFATVGFGDITATSQVARVAVIAQMIFDLLVLGLVVKVFVGAVEIGRELHTTRQDSESS